MAALATTRSMCASVMCSPLQATEAVGGKQSRILSQFCGNNGKNHSKKLENLNFSSDFNHNTIARNSKLNIFVRSHKSALNNYIFLSSVNPSSSFSPDDESIEKSNNFDDVNKPQNSNKSEELKTIDILKNSDLSSISFSQKNGVNGEKSVDKLKKNENNEQKKPEDYKNNGTDIPHFLISFLGIIGALETSYLTYNKLMGESVFCPIGGSCGGVLDSPWGSFLGLPLSLVGFLAYSSTLFLTQTDRYIRSNETKTSTHFLEFLRKYDIPKNVLFGLSSIMASTSVYLLYILNTELEGFPCVYCYVSAILSLSLFALTLKGFSGKELKSTAVPRAGFTLLAVSAYIFSVTFADVRSAYAGSVELDLPPIEPKISTFSSEPTLALAKHLKSIGAKMYGAFWCSHCFEQKQMFGQEAMKVVEYVECYPEGYRRGVKLASACVDANIEGFPTWIVSGQVLAGEQDLDRLAEVSGFDTSKYFK